MLKFSKINDKEYHLDIPSTFEVLEVLLSYVEDILELTPLDSNQSYNVIIAISEIVSNAIEHGNKFDKNKEVKMDVFILDDKIQFKIRDFGKGFNPAEIENPLDSDNLLKSDGRGIFIARELVDKIEYIFHKDGTETIVTKFYEHK